ncbi:phosphoenolpyruvate--protein phosphotransferase [Bartonella sp. HY761]|uniref:phosphoenolpyruvate--protein phosphotransferase n=1 Tax=Bartonella sp. HY761 TaxID=2979330 RepID=UPI0021E2FBC8|nr:phosphoenolpyruvate--protein phosphotransferase [Bartonella sp. HY761]UXN08132.1 phosphoenolpyruvate--protein phosphotransferase [Bartonella sp. HY761]
MCEKLISPELNILNPAGLHARPAAVFASKAKTFASAINLIVNNKKVNGKSVVAIMGLSTRKGDLIQIEAIGDDASQAIDDLTNLINDRCGEHDEEAPEEIIADLATTVLAETKTILTGVAASPGIAIGKVFQYKLQQFDIHEYADDSKKEQQLFEDALVEASGQIEVIKAALGSSAKQAILSAHQELLQDPDLLALTYAGLAEKKTAAFAWRAAFSAYSAKLESQENNLLRERATDIRDIGRRVLAILAGTDLKKIEVPEGSILVAEDLTPSDTVALDPARVVGFCTRTGGATSHVAILARSLGIPAICGISQRALSLPDDLLVMMDASQGFLNINPSEQDIQQAHDEQDRIAARQKADQAVAHQQAYTKDGCRVEVVANIRNANDAREAIEHGAEGVGLLRTEFLFADKATAPDEVEQKREYCAIANALGKDKPLVIRTLDVGGDKPLSYLPLPAEDNPFLGLRGIRVGIVRPDLLRIQIRAILQAAGLCKLHIMFPMITSIAELRASKKIVEEECEKLGVSGVKVGIMVEVPSVAFLAERFAAEVDFFSIGTNDLTQYVLAMDRGHPELARYADALHPAVLTAIDVTCKGAAQHGKWVGVCGGLASEPLATPLLLGLGVKELSCSTPVIAEIKAIISRWSLSDCQKLAENILTLDDTDAVRKALKQQQR